MKHLIISSILLFYFSAIAHSQTTIKDTVEIKSGIYEFKVTFPKSMEVQEELNVPDDAKYVSIKQGAKIKVQFSDTDDYIYYTYLTYTDTELKAKYNFLNDNSEETRVFRIKKDQFSQITKPLYSRFKGFKAGAYTVPVRLRGVGNDFDFESSLSLTANFIAGFGSKYKQDSWLDTSIGVGISSIQLDSINSNVTADRSAAAFTLSFGAVIKANQYANIGLFLGWDTLGLNDNSVEWKYNNKPWIGVGINITFNELSTDKSPQNVNN